MTVFKNEKIKIFRFSQGIRRNREGNSIDIFDFKPRSRNRRSYQ